ncbi:MAG: RNA polymerase sigma factor [Candidatus Rokuibacteriota bacterium]
MGPQPFEAVLEAHHAEIFRYLRRVTARSSDADDLSQETFLRAWKAYRGLDGGANVRAWLFTIATNLARNHFRDERRRRNAQAQARSVRSEFDGAQPDGEAVFNETRTRLDAAVARLPLKQRLAFVQRKIHDLDYEAIARSLGCSAETARAHVFQALRKLRRELEGLALPAMERQA